LWTYNFGVSDADEDGCMMMSQDFGGGGAEEMISDWQHALHIVTTGLQRVKTKR
jgi:hypothetical protein